MFVEILTLSVSPTKISLMNTSKYRRLDTFFLNIDGSIPKPISQPKENNNPHITQYSEYIHILKEKKKAFFYNKPSQYIWIYLVIPLCYLCCNLFLLATCLPQLFWSAFFGTFHGLCYGVCLHSTTLGYESGCPTIYYQLYISGPKLKWQNILI